MRLIGSQSAKGVSARSKNNAPTGDNPQRVLDRPALSRREMLGIGGALLMGGGLATAMGSRRGTKADNGPTSSSPRPKAMTSI